jgi:uracil-DNA glycosylase family 4
MKDGEIKVIEEIRICSEWKKIEFATIEVPKLIILFGTEVAKLFLGDNISTITKVLGNIYTTEIKKQKVFIIPLPHPSYVLTFPPGSPLP